MERADDRKQRDSRVRSASTVKLRNEKPRFRGFSLVAGEGSERNPLNCETSICRCLGLGFTLLGSMFILEPSLTESLEAPQAALITLKGITWNHTRGYAPLAATATISMSAR